jgi:membrane-associated phospholipid phosphatase
LIAGLLPESPVRVNTMARRIRAALLALGLWAFSAGALAQETNESAAAEEKITENPVAWRPHFRRAGIWDAVALGGATGLCLTELLLPRRSEALWEGPILWDEAIRDMFVLDSRRQRAVAATVADVMFAGSLVQTMVVDNLIFAWGVHGEPATAFQMSAANAEAYAFTFALTGWIKRLAGRTRPYAAECERDPGYSAACGEPSSYRSFFSGHAAFTAVGAGLVCAHHLHLPLFGNRLLDAGACAAGVGLTLATSAMRMASDKHWASDVAVGHLVGFASGYLIPTLFFYRFHSPGDRAKPRDTVWLPSIGPHSVGLQVTGRL